jgi:type III restriction enzyme
MTIRGDKQTFRNEDLVLRVTTDIDPRIWDESRYEAFLDELCGTREYQKEAIRTTLRYLLGRKYANLRELAQQNLSENSELQQRYGSWPNMERHLQLPDQLSCSLDLATATGKSWVLYGIAAILLAEGAVDRVLVLCPSNTIESGLLEKFRVLAASSDLRDLLPEDAKVRVPKIINASETIVGGSICIENYHAILEHVKSSIRDSLKGQGQRVAVLNDEAHHVANETGTNARKWKEFLLSDDYGFRFIVGLSGTCYVGDDYFVDVISRYSLRQAIEDRFVKRVEYVAQMPETSNPEEKWQLVYNRHQEWKKRLKKRGIRPLTIVVTKNIADCKRVAEELQGFLQEWEKISTKDAEKKVLPVTSAAEHQPNIARLRNVDTSTSPVEWITSVAMLSEGWDVKNVFQIVPHEERAFNSKLLIAQVLGRGLRRPEGWTGEDPIVTVFNHDAWSGRIKHLVNEILEIQRRISSRVLKASEYNFDLYNIDYTREEDTSEFAKRGEYRFLEDGFVVLPSQVEVEDAVVEFERAVTGERTKFKTQIQHKTYTAEEVAEVMFQRLKSIDEESKDAEDPKGRTNYSVRFPLERCVQVVGDSLKRMRIKSGRVTEDNRQKFLAALGTLRRKKAKRVVYRLRPKALVTLSTKERQSESCTAAELRHGSKTIFYGPGCESTLQDEEVKFFREIEDKDGDFTGARVPVDNSHDFRTPLNLVIADASNERRFVRLLSERQNAQAVDAWIKNTPQKFYWIEYAWKKREHPKRGEFSPDFFVKIGDAIYVIEIKDDGEIAEPTLENQKKYEYAISHFKRLNEWLKKQGLAQRYQFNFLSPKNYGAFFQKLRDKDLTGFRSELDVVLATVNGSSS